MANKTSVLTFVELLWIGGGCYKLQCVADIYVMGKHVITIIRVLMESLPDIYTGRSVYANMCTHIQACTEAYTHTHTVNKQNEHEILHVRSSIVVVLLDAPWVDALHMYWPPSSNPMSQISRIDSTKFSPELTLRGVL